jgi:hypothetical protein
MPDQKPPPLAADELTTVWRLLQFQRESFVRKVEGVSDAHAARVFVPSGTSLLWLTQHLADAESIWVLERFAGSGPTESRSADAESLDAAIGAYRSVWSAADAVIGDAPGLDERCRAAAFAVNLRWVLMHLLEETARHAGHADILRELIDGETGR